MKKVIKLTESDLVKIVKRVIEEQITDKGPIPAEVKEIRISDDTLRYLNSNFKLKLKQVEEPETFMDKLNNSQVGITSFPINTDTGWNVTIIPAYIKMGSEESKSGKFQFSFEPFDKVNGKYMLRWTKTIPYKS